MRDALATRWGREPGFSVIQAHVPVTNHLATRRGREPGFSVIQAHVPVTNHLAPRMGAVMRHLTRQASRSLRNETLETNSPS